MQTFEVTTKLLQIKFLGKLICFEEGAILIATDVHTLENIFAVFPVFLRLLLARKFLSKFY